jgi:hypothetical protein
VEIGKQGNEVFADVDDLTKDQAEQLVRQGVFDTAAASTKITRSDGETVTPEDLGIDRGFLASRTDDGRFVEPRNERMSSEKELQDIKDEIQRQKNQADTNSGVDPQRFSQGLQTAQTNNAENSNGRPSSEDFTPPGLEDTGVESLSEQFNDFQTEFDNPFERRNN